MRERPPSSSSSAAVASAPPAPFPRLRLAVLLVLLPSSLASFAGKYGTKSYWDGMYSGEGQATRDGLPASEFSWYCGWRELEPFWSELVPLSTSSPRVLVPGVGNDPTIVGLYDAGWSDVTAFDYSEAAIDSALALIGERSIELRCADALALPYADASFDAVLDKGTLDSIGINSVESLQRAVAEFERVVAPDGVVVCISRALEPAELLAAFHASQWSLERDGGVHITESGEASIDLSAGLFAWRRRLARDGAAAEGAGARVVPPLR
jgi:SAM-dependent methyltransferase